jgi:two-component system response regulator AlgR
MKVLIVDDEQLARERIARLIQALPDYRVEGEAADGKEALRKQNEVQADIVLMDIRMPGMDGLEAARYLAELETPPAVIFATAYSDHALEAFETQAIGYLLKPIRREHLEHALAIARRLTRPQLAALDQQRDTEKRSRSHICARFRGNLELIPLDEIYYFHADQKYVNVRHRHGSILIEEPLKSLEQEFGDRFVRIHRNALVAIAYINGLEKTAEGHQAVLFKEIDDQLEVSRRHIPHLRALLKRM